MTISMYKQATSTSFRKKRIRMQHLTNVVSNFNISVVEI
jgi:hypothetical protein